MDAHEHYETKTAIAGQNIGIARVGDKTYAIGRLNDQQDGRFYGSNKADRRIFLNLKKSSRVVSSLG
jgi:hypothetical protein